MEYCHLTRELRDISRSEDHLRHDESEEYEGYRIERTSIPLGDGCELSAIWGWTRHHGIAIGINYGCPEALEAYVPGLDLEPVPVRPDEITGIIDAWPDYRGLMRS